MVGGAPVVVLNIRSGKLMEKIKVGVVGATGYTGMELVRLLAQHPSVELTHATSERFSGKRLDALFPSLIGVTSLVLKDLKDDEVVHSCDFIFSCLPHQQAMEHVVRWVQAGKKVVDLSADFRFRSATVYGQWYAKHASPDLLKKSVYGLPEIYRKEISKASLVGNPGCYPTGAILALAPLLKNKLVESTGIVVDSKSGVTGAGRAAALESLYSEVNDSIHAYKVGGQHRHIPEIEQELSSAAGQPVTISFTPHLVPMDRGILSTIYARPTKKMDAKSILNCLEKTYAQEPFVSVLPEGVFPHTKDVRGTNRCLIGAAVDVRSNTVVVVSAIDNLMKGASGQAVHNMNLMLGFEETTGLTALPLVP